MFHFANKFKSHFEFIFLYPRNYILIKNWNKKKCWKWILNAVITIEILYCHQHIHQNWNLNWKRHNKVLGDENLSHESHLIGLLPTTSVTACKLKQNLLLKYDCGSDWRNPILFSFGCCLKLHENQLKKNEFSLSGITTASEKQWATYADIVFMGIESGMRVSFDRAQFHAIQPNSLLITFKIPSHMTQATAQHQHLHQQQQQH